MQISLVKHALIITILILWLAPLSAHSEQITIPDLSNLPEADVYVLGEVHDNPAHHLAQAAAIAALSPTAVVFEMFTDTTALRIRPEMLGDAAALSDALNWDASGWPDFAIYFPIFTASGDAGIYGGGTDRAIVRDAVSEGAIAAFGDSGALFGLDRVLDDDEQIAREDLQFAAHCDALPFEMLAGMVEAQRYRDAVLARAVIAASLETGGPVAVITGNGHARKDWGVPAMLEIADPELRVLSLGQFEVAPDEDVPYDIWLLADPVDREDPCAAFADK